jgi:hypothetical protein
MPDHWTAHQFDRFSTCLRSSKVRAHQIKTTARIDLIDLMVLGWQF